MGPTVPFGELVFIPDLPENVIKVPKVGDVLASSSGSDAFVTLSRSTPEISGQLDTADASTLHGGEEATAVSDATGQKWALKVDSVKAVGDLQGDNVSLSFVSASSVPQSLVGQNLRIVVGSTKQLDSVLTVPISAIYTSEGGTSFIDLVTPKSVRKTKVVIGADDNGTVVIHDANGLLHAGEDVEVGTYAKLSKAK
jgi:multidrug efflux pump subunit AcrA (membrane-fusion protein)